jgi:hypothetical protein
MKHSLVWYGLYLTKYGDKLHNLYSFPDIIRQVQVKANEVSGACGTHGRGEKIV